MKSRLQLLLGIAVIAALFMLGMLVWMDRLQPVRITVSALPEQSIQVSVSGAVNDPGIVQLPSGARLQEAVDAAGGFTENADLSVLNLAGRVGDGEQVVIPEIGAAQTDAGVAQVGSQGALIDLNTASVQELDELPGIGDVLAGRIVEYRETQGPFTSIDQLAEIEGISPRLVERIRPLVTISGQT